jgi:hypothetical protein
MGRVHGSFAEATITKRLPAILDKTRSDVLACAEAAGQQSTADSGLTVAQVCAPCATLAVCVQGH